MTSKIKLPENRFLIILFICLGLSLRLAYLLANKNFDYDEIVVWTVANKNFLDILLGNYFPFRFHPPAYYLFIHFWKYPIDYEVWLRFPSVIIGSFNILLIYFFTKKITSEKIGITSAFIFTLSSYHIYWSVQARIYEILLFFSFISLITIVNLIKNPNNKLWILFIITNISGFLIDYSFLWTYLVINIYFVISQIIYPFIIKKKLEGNLILLWIISNLFIFSLLSPLFMRVSMLTLSSKEALAGWITRPEIRSLIPTMINQLVYYLEINNHFPFYYISNYFFYWGVIAALFLVIFRIIFGNKKKYILIILISLLPTIISVIVSQFYPIFLHYNIMIVSIGSIILLSIFLTKNKIILLLGLFLWILINVNNLLIYITNPSIEDWSSTSIFLKEHINKDYKLLFLPSYYKNSFLYYNKRFNIINPVPKEVNLDNDNLILRKIKYLQEQNLKFCVIVNKYMGKTFIPIVENYNLYTNKISGINIYCT